MIGRCADEGQAQCDVDAVLEGERFEGDERLVVVHCEHRVVALAGGCVKKCIGGERAGNVDAPRAELRNRRGDDFDFLAAERSLFARMRIEAADRQPRILDGEIAGKARARDLRSAHEEILGQRSGNIFQRDVDRDGHRQQALRGHQHDREGVRNAMPHGEFRQKPCVSGVREPLLYQDVLGYGCRDGG